MSRVRILLLPQVNQTMPVALAPTVNLVSRRHGFFSGGSLVEVNTSLESSWSLILIFAGFNLNRGLLDELEQVIVCAILCRNRFL